MKFSIVVPSFNRAHMIHNAIISVINQTYKNWELIIVDDGSTDKTKEIIDKFIKIDNRVRYLFQKNKERSSARNYGIKEAKGDWICFLDSDDIYYKKHLNEYYSLIKKNNFEKGLYFSGLSYAKHSQDLEEYDLSHENNVEFILLNTIGTPRACVHKSILSKNLFNEKIKIGEDRELWSRILRNHPLYWHNKKTFIEIEHPQRSVNLSLEKEGLNTIKSIISRNKKIIRINVKRKVLSNFYFYVSKGYLKKNKKFKCIINLIISIFYSLKSKQTKHKILLLLSIFHLYKKSVYLEYLK